MCVFEFCFCLFLGFVFGVALFDGVLCCSLDVVLCCLCCGVCVVCVVVVHAVVVVGCWWSGLLHRNNKNTAKTNLGGCCWCGLFVFMMFVCVCVLCLLGVCVRGCLLCC